MTFWNRGGRGSQLPPAPPIYPWRDPELPAVVHMVVTEGQAFRCENCGGVHAFEGQDVVTECGIVVTTWPIPWEPSLDVTCVSCLNADWLDQLGDDVTKATTVGGGARSGRHEPSRSA